MKRTLILVLLCAGALTAFGIPSYFSEMEAFAQFDKSTMINKKLRSAKESMDKGDYQSAINTLNSLLKLSPNHSKAQEMYDQCRQGIKQQKAREDQAFKDACKSSSIDALNEFIRRYPNSEYIQSAKQRLDDYSIWEIAKKRNTIDSYNLYLQKSSLLAYKEDAQAAIKKIKADHAWSVCMNTENESILNDFISTYPESPNINEAKYKLNVLKGERLYKDGFTDAAYNYLDSANIHRLLTGDAAKHYSELKGKKTFNEMMSSSDINKVRKYQKTLLFTSQYYDDISNHLALLLGAKLNAWSSEYDMEEALSFAMDRSTKATVKNYISQAKSQYRKYERQRKSRARKAWWKNNFKIGIDADFGTNLDSNAGSDMFYSVGLVGRFGNYQKKINFITGVKYRWLRIMPKYGSFYDDKKDDWQLFGGAVCVPVNFHFNIVDVSLRSRFYLGIGCEYGYIFPKEHYKEIMDKNYISVFPQLGITSPNFEISCYFKSYVLGPFINVSNNTTKGFDCNIMIGIQMAVYF